MAFHVRHRYGGNESSPPLDSLDGCLTRSKKTRQMWST
jgi:hypothetical protein